MLAMPQLLNHWASSFGWMCVGNMALCVFFGLKNTPLGPLASVSHSQLNILHRIVGYTTVFLLVLHALVYTIHFGRQGRLVQLLKKEDLEGMGACVAMLVLLMGVFRHKHYELFYASHIMGFMAVVLLAALHRPNWAKKIPTVMLIIFSMWTVDRLIRLSKLLYNLVNNSATLYPLPYKGTRIVLKKPGMENALPGSHCLLWVPRLRLFETHPFTIVSNDASGLELVVKSHKGFTKTVGSFATVNPRATLSASIDGPYGSLPDMGNYDKLILIAGGSGAAFTFGVMNRIMMQREKLAIQSIEFVWAVRHVEQLSWFRRHLRDIANSEYPISVKVYVTGASGSVHDESGPLISPCGAERGILLRDDAFDYQTISDIDDLCELTGDEQKCNPLFEKLDVNETPVPLSWKLASIVLVTAIGFGSQWSSGVTSAIKSTIKKELHINNTQFSVLEASEDFMVTALMLVSGIVTDRICGAGIGKIGAFAGKSSANIISKRLGFAWVFWIAVFMNIFTNVITGVFYFFTKVANRRYHGINDPATGEKLTEKTRKFEYRKILELPWTFWAVMGFSLFETSAAIVFLQNATGLAGQRFGTDSIAAGWYSSVLQYSGFFVVPLLGVFLDLYGSRIFVLIFCGIGMFISMLLVCFSGAVKGTAASFGVFAFAYCFGPTTIIDSTRTSMWDSTVIGSAYAIQITMNNAIITGKIQDADNKSYDDVTIVYVVLAGLSVVVSLLLTIGAWKFVDLGHLQWSRKKRIAQGSLLNKRKEIFTKENGEKNRRASLACFATLILLIIGSWCGYFWGVATGNND
ncbi:ferric-chelate reductase [Fusarium denticulatum]|uniref:ferric-chelate reductase (NADPH) n=1 Tax=Fusarium denticulatum TaxID=48507 RepID=A0A8H5XJH5_9HYPO|nr:ferric-chelate reductase [Fusarium denticulatum]